MLALGPRHLVLAIFVASAIYVHLRGRVRYGWLRALTSWLVLLAPVNALMYLFSRTPRTAFLDPAQFPELAPLQRNWQTICDEALRLNEEGSIRAAATYNDLGFNSLFRSGWKRFYLSWYGQEPPSALALCPQTVALLRSIPTVKAAMFASLAPGGKLVTHRDPYAGSLRYHLGLVTPNDPRCYMEVDGERRHWRDGEALMFDETYIHTAANLTDRPRIILFCDVERPLRTAPMRWFNRLFSRHVMAAAATQNVPGEHVGWMNRAFYWLYQVRAQAKKLKARHRRLYYIGKWALIVTVLWLIFW